MRGAELFGCSCLRCPVCREPDGDLLAALSCADSLLDGLACGVEEHDAEDETGAVVPVPEVCNSRIVSKTVTAGMAAGRPRDALICTRMRLSHAQAPDTDAALPPAPASAPSAPAPAPVAPAIRKVRARCDALFTARAGTTSARRALPSPALRRARASYAPLCASYAHCCAASASGACSQAAVCGARHGQAASCFVRPRRSGSGARQARAWSKRIRTPYAEARRATRHRRSMSFVRAQVLFCSSRRNELKSEKRELSFGDMSKARL